MRISAKVSGAGQNGLTRMPMLDIGSIDEELCDERGRLDEAKCRRVLNHPNSGVQIASTDGIQEFAFTLELLKQTRDACQRLIDDRGKRDTRDAHGEAECADDVHAERNMKRDRVVYVRMDIKYKTSVGENGAIRLTVNIDNPKGTVGVAERIAMDYALIVARIANNIADQMAAANGTWGYEFKGGPGCPTLFEDARRIDAELKQRAIIREANISMWKCERRTASGYCSPCKFSCPHCKGGKCVEIEAADGAAAAKLVEAEGAQLLEKEEEK